MSTEPPKGNGLLSTLAASGDRGIQLAIIVLIAFSGGGNFLTTVNRSDENRAEILRAIKQINELHATLDDSIRHMQREDQHDTETLAILQRIEQKLKP